MPPTVVWIYTKLEYLLPMWYWLILFLVSIVLTGLPRSPLWKMIPEFITIRLKKPRVIRIRVIVTGVAVCVLLFTPLAHFLFPGIVKGTVYSKNDSKVRIKGAIVVIESLVSGIKKDTSTDAKGTFLVPFPRRHLGPAILRVTDDSGIYLPFEEKCDITSKRFFHVPMHAGLPEYTIRFLKPESYHVYLPGPLEVSAVFETKDGTVHIPEPKDHVELHLDGKTKEYVEMQRGLTDRVTWTESRDQFELYELREHEVRVVITPRVSSEKKEVSKSTFFTPLWHDALQDCTYWFIPLPEKSDWKSSNEGTKGSLKPNDSGNIMSLTGKRIPWGPIAFSLKVKTHNKEFVNVVIRLRKKYRIIIGDGDLSTIRIERGEPSAEGTDWFLLSGSPHKLNAEIVPKEWMDITVEFDPQYRQDTGRLYIRILSPSDEAPLLLTAEAPLPREQTSEISHQIQIGHINPSSRRPGKDIEYSSVTFRDFCVYGLRRKSAKKS